MPKKVNKTIVSEEKAVSKTLGFIGVRNDSNSIWVDVNDGRIVRIRPLHFDDHQAPETLNAWKIDVRGKSLEASLKS